MANRFQQYQLAVGDNIGNPETLNGRFRDLDLRLGAQEDIEKTWDAAIEALQAMGVDQVNSALFPVFTHIQDLANLGTIFTANSDDEVAVASGARTFVINEESRASFAPAAYLCAFVTNDLSKAMLGKLVSYNNVSGELVIDVDKLAGSGTGAGWTISAAAATDNAEALEGAQSAADDAQVAASTATAIQSVILAVQLDIQAKSIAAASAASDAAAAKAQAQALEATVQSLHDQTVANIASFNALYLGSHAVDPTLTNTGAALTEGMLYFNTTAHELREYHGAPTNAWVTSYHASGSAVDSFNGRTGGVNPADGDYTGDQIVITPSGGITASRVSDALGGIDTRVTATEGLLTGYDGNSRTIQLKRTTASGQGAPTTLADGEVKIDVYDNKLYWRDKLAAVVKAMPLLTNPLSTARQILTSGLATGGGDMTADRTINVPAASQAEAEAGTDNTKAMTPLRVSQAIAALVSTAWDAISGKPTSVSGYGITDAYTKTEVDAADALALLKTGGTMLGDIILNGDPTNILHPATKRYVDNAIAGMKIKDAVLCATTAALPTNTRSGNVLTSSANAALAIDGIAPAIGDRVLVMNEATAANNGIYTVTAIGSASAQWQLTRANDFLTWTQVPGAMCIVEEGTVNADRGYVCTSDPGGTINTSTITFSMFFSAGVYQQHSANLDLWSAFAPSARSISPGTGIIGGGNLSANVTIALDPTSSLVKQVGEIITMAANSVPTGFIECNGGAISRTAYASLFAKIGTTFGAGDGSTTFNIPDYRGMFLRGWDHGAGRDAGRTMPSYQADALQNITGGWGVAGAPTWQAASGAFYVSGNTLKVPASGGGATANGNMNFDASRVVRTDDETRPMNSSVLFCIKY